MPAERPSTPEKGEVRLPSLGPTTEKLLISVTPVQLETTNDAVFHHFETNSKLHALPVVKDGVPVGLINRNYFFACYAQPYRKELYGHRACTAFMDPRPLMVDKKLTIHELSQTLIGADQRHVADGFIITDNGYYRGLGTGQDLIREITEMQLIAARYANPLTLLPGNVPINEHIDRLLAANIAFVACYCDLNNFKPFNDTYGYRRGDDMIRLTAKILTGICDAQRDFVGHIGGDDFMLLLQSEDWYSRCERVLDQFEAEAPLLFDEPDRTRGGLVSEDRAGNRMLFPITSIAMGAVLVNEGVFSSNLDVSTMATEAKKQAKRANNNALFVERRKPVAGAPD
jgi:GGDEF domain-containing protein